MLDELNSSNMLGNSRQFQSCLKPLKLPVFGKSDRSKTKFEEFWVLFTSLLGENSEAPNVKMASLHNQSFTTRILGSKGNIKSKI